MNRREAERHGRRGENWAALWLRLQGWRIVGRRVKTRRGEIDLIARKGKVVAFIEVKWRASGIALDSAIDEYRLKRVAAAVEAVGHRYASDNDMMRIDIVLIAPRRWPRRIVNAWQP